MGSVGPDSLNGGARGTESRDALFKLRGAVKKGSASNQELEALARDATRTLLQHGVPNNEITHRLLAAGLGKRAARDVVVQVSRHLAQLPSLARPAARALMETGVAEPEVRQRLERMGLSAEAARSIVTEEKAKLGTRSALTPADRAPSRKRGILRGVLGVVAAVGFIIGLLCCVTGAWQLASLFRLPQQLLDRASRFVGPLLLAIGAALTIGGFLLARFASDRPRMWWLPPLTISLGIVVAATLTCVLSLLFWMPEWLLSLAFLVALVGGLWLLIKSIPVLPGQTVVGSIAFAVALFSVPLPAYTRARHLSYAHERRTLLEPVIRGCAGLATDEAFIEAINSPAQLGALPKSSGSLVVLRATRKPSSTSYDVRIALWEAYLPPDLLSNDASSVRAVAVVGSYVAVSPWAEVVAPVLVYSWPDRELKLRETLRTGLDPSVGVSSSEMYRAAASSLQEVLARSRSPEADLWEKHP